MSTALESPTEDRPADSDDGASSEPSSRDQDSGRGLERTLGYWDNVFLGVGSILGAGIYAIIGESAAYAGSMLWLSLLIAALTALLCAACYGELVSRFPDSGGGYEYIAQAFGRRFANVMAVVLFLTGIVSPAAIALAFGQYVSRLADIPVMWSATAAIIVMATVNVFGARGSSWLNIGATVVTVAGLALVAGVCAPSIGDTPLIELPHAGFAGILSGAALAFFSFVGFEDVVKMAEETEQPRIKVPWALVSSGIFVTVVYVIIAISAVSVVSWNDLAESEGPLGEVMQSAWGSTGSLIISVVALFATSKCILTNIMSNSRLVYDLSRDTALPQFFGKLLPRFRTPVFAIVTIAVLTWLFALIGDLGTVASISNLLILTLFAMVCLSLAKLRISEKGEEPKFRLPLNVRGVSLINIAAIAMLLLMLAFNVYNLVGGKS